MFLKRYLFCCLWWVGLSFLFVAPSLAVFFKTSQFNQNVSNWNTGAVKTMRSSKCTLSPSPWPRLPLLCILNIRQLEFHRITILTRCVILILCVCNGTLFCCLWWAGLCFLCCTLSCSVLVRIFVQSGRVEMEYGCGDKYGSQ